MDDTKPKELWDRFDNEPERAYRAFESFLYLPGERTILAAYRSHVGNPNAAKPSDTWSGWASRFAWRERAAAYDAHMASLRREAYEQGVREEATRQGVLAERMRAEAFEMLHGTYEKGMDWLQREDFNPSEMTIGNVIQITKLHMEATKMFEVVEAPGASPDWTEEDDEEIDRIVKEVEAEEDSEKGAGEAGFEESESEQH